MTSEVARRMKTWKPQELLAARCLAIGYTQEMTAREVARDIVTIQRWCRREDFHQLVEGFKLTAVQRVEPLIMANLELALDLQRKMFAGEVSPGDKRYLEARAFIARFLDKLLYVEPATSAGGSSAPLAAIQLNVAGGTPPPALT